MDKKLILGFLLLVLISAALFFARTSNAAFLLIDEHGGLVWQVLSRESDDDEGDEAQVEIRTTNRGSGRETSTEARLSIEDGRVRLQVSSPSGETEMDVTEVENDIIRVREKLEDQEIRIRARVGRLEIRHKGVGALTNFPVSVNPQTNELTITTPSGTRVVTVLPSVAIANILQSNIMDRILAAVSGPSPLETPEPVEEEEEEEGTEAAELDEEEEIEFSGVIEAIGTTQWVIGGRTVNVSTQTELDEGLAVGVLAKVEGELLSNGTIAAEEIETDQEVELVEEDGALVFKIRGAKDVRFLNLVAMQAPVNALVSAQTGEVLSVNRPWFLDFFGFLFTQ